MNDIELARLLLGDSKTSSTSTTSAQSGTSVIPGRTRTYTAVALSDSSEGMVTVRVNGDVVGANGSTSITLPTQAVVYEGDTVNVVVVNGSPMVTGGAGWGDAIDVRVSDVQEDARLAKQAAQRAQGAAEVAQTAAAEAKGFALTAQTSAENAQRDARIANNAADDALTQLSIVEDVSGTLSWITEHGTFVPTEDTEVQNGTVYFELVDGEHVPVTNPTGNPQEQGWYILDISDSQTEYIMAHLAVTESGLWVLPNGRGSGDTPATASGYKLLLSSNGAYLYDSTGHIVTTYGESITFDSSRPQSIGGEDAFILYYDSDDDGVPDTIHIGGTRVVIGAGGKTLSEMLADVAQASSDAQAALDSATIVITSTHGNLFKNGSESTVLQVAVFPNGGTRCDTIEDVRARFGATSYIEWRWKHEATGEWGTLVSSDEHISHGGMWLTVTPDDVATKTSFEASLIVPD